MQYLSHSRARLFLACRRRYFYERVQRLEPRIPPRARQRGRAFAAALAALPDRDAVERAILDAYAEPTSQSDADAWLIERDILRALALGYLERYGVEASREMEYDLPLAHPETGEDDPTWRIRGRIDGMIVLDEAAGRARLVEDKLSSRVTAVSIARLQLDAQVTEYVLALAALGWTADVEYRITLWPQLAPRRGESRDAFAARVTDDIAARQERYYVCTRVIFPRDHLAEYARGRWQIAKDIERAHGDNTWYQNTTHCWEYGGCPYIPLCTMQPDAEDLYVANA